MDFLFRNLDKQRKNKKNDFGGVMSNFAKKFQHLCTEYIIHCTLDIAMHYKSPTIYIKCLNYSCGKLQVYSEKAYFKSLGAIVLIYMYVLNCTVVLWLSPLKGHGHDFGQILILFFTML